MESLIDEKIRAFLAVETRDGHGYGHGYGSGDGSGHGSGDGSGHGYGSGSGHGYGSGDGYGDGYGSGYGHGYGSGDGHGYGSGDGSGHGSGDGSGHGYGVKSFDGKCFHTIDGVSTQIDQIRGNVARGFTLNSDLSLSPCFVVKGENMFAHGATLRNAQEALIEKLMEEMSEEERVDAFLAEFQAGKEYPAKAFYDWHHRLTGSCEFGRDAFVKDHGIDVENDKMTVARFIELTENAYGASVIRMVKERMA